MRGKEANRWGSRCAAAALAGAMLLGLLPGAQASENTQDTQTPGLGQVSMDWSRDIYNGITLEHIISENENGLQKSYTVTYNPETTQVKPLLSYGPYVMGGDIMSDLVSQAEEDGSKVVFAINGDAYDTSNGVSNGLMIRDGILISTSHNNSAEAVGFTAEGKAIYGHTNLTITATPEDGEAITVNHVNKERKLNTENVYLLTEQFASATNSTQPGVEVVLDVTTPGYEGLVVGGEITATVASVNQVEANVDKNQTPIGENQIVLSTNSAGSRYDDLSALTEGEQVTVSVANNNSDVDWSQATQALGIFHVLMWNGQVNESAYNGDTDIHPRTVMGVKEDGSLVFFQCDGRQAGWAMGISFRNIVDYMKAQGCVSVFNFDGGGSSTITATLPGDEQSTILNRPSDGSERANCNALLFVAQSEPDPDTTLLHIYPDIDEGYGNKVMVLENGKLGLKVGATDGNYHYKTLDSALTYAVDGEIGTVSENGVFTAAAGTHEGTITVSTEDGSASGVLEVQVVDSITKLTADRSILSVAPGATAKMSFTAEYNGTPVVLTSEALTFELSDDSLGSIASDGTFTAAETQGTGELKISYKDYTLNLPVEIGKLPVPLNDFEEDFEEAGWKWRYFNGADGGLGDRGGDAKMSINYDERYVKSGDGSLRVDYDFATKPLTGTVTCETGPVDELYLEGQPKAIGCWVYGDGNGVWLRIQLAPAAYAGDVYVDWVGWRYVENAIPATASFPYRLVWGVRVLGTANVANGKKGTIYVDGLRAVYDFKNDDTLAPELVPGTEVTPADGAVDVSNEPDISITVRDPQVEGQPYTGINTERTKLWINGKVMDLSAIQQEVAADGSVKITFHPGALTALRPGLNKVKYRVEDNSGNKFFHEWSFTVEGYAVNLEETVPAGEKAAAGSTFHYIVNATDYRNFEEFQFDLSFDPKYVTLVDAAYDSRLTADVNEVDAEAGTVRYTLTGMDKLEKDEENPLVDLTFKVGNSAGGQTGIKVNKASVRQTGEVTGTDLILDGYDREVALKYTLSWSGSTVGRETQLKLVDDQGTPVSGMSFHVTQNGEPVALDGVTGEDGTLSTGLFGTYPAGTEFQVWVEDADGALSNTQKITVYDSLGTADPAKVTVTTGQDPATSVGISWETSLDVESGELVIGKTADLTGEDTRTISAQGKDIETMVSGNVRLYQSWGVRADGLEPDTTYYYKVGSGEHYSAIQSFTTAPADGDMTIAFYGDIQGAYAQFPQAIEALKALYPDVDLNLQAGDVSDDGQSYSDWNAAYEGFGSYLSNGIWAPTIGNHDSSNDAQAFASYFYGPDNGTYDTPRNYWFQMGDIIFYNLDTEATYTYDPGFKTQIAHMKEVFAASDAEYKVVLMHRSAYPMSYDEADVRALHTEFEKMGVCLVLSGHDHIYNRTEMYQGEKAPGTGIPYVVGGCSSGSKYYDADSEGRPWQDVVYDDNNPVFSVLKMKDGVLTFEAYAMEEEGTRMVDSFTVKSRQAESEDSGSTGVVVPSGPDVNEPVTSGSTTAVTVEVKPAVSGGVAKTEISASTMDKAVTSVIEAARKAGTTPVVELALDTGKADSLSVTLPVDELKTLSGEQGSLAITSDAADVTLDAAALAAIGEQAGGKVTLAVSAVDSDDLTEAQKAAAGDGVVYDLSLTSGGKAIAEVKTGKATITLPYALKEGQEADGVVVYCMDDEAGLTACQTSCDAAEGTVTFTASRFGKYVVAYDAALAWTNPYTDVDENDWFYEAVRYTGVNGLMNGTSATTFSPALQVSRAMLMTMLARMDGAETDGGSTWYEKGMAWAMAEGVSDGTNPEGNITREQIAAMLYRTAGSPAVTGSLTEFPDGATVSSWAADAMTWAVSLGLFQGDSAGQLNPSGEATRMEVAVILMRFCQRQNA